MCWNFKNELLRSCTNSREFKLLSRHLSVGLTKASTLINYSPLLDHELLIILDMQPLTITVGGNVYRLEKEISDHERSVNFMATHIDSGEQVILKKVHRHHHIDKITRSRLEQFSAINHPNIVPIYDIVIEEESVYIVQEYTKGESLE